MRIIGNTFLRRLILTSIYVAGVVGIAASGGGGGSDSDSRSFEEKIEVGESVANGDRSSSNDEFRNLVRKVQKELTSLGYDLGQIDGIRGPKTAKAIKQFQRDRGLNPDGLVTDELLLNLDAVSAYVYSNWEECVTKEGEFFEGLKKDIKNGKSIRSKLLMRNNNLNAEQIDVLEILVKVKSNRKISISIMTMCSLSYPSSSPFNKQQIEKLRKAMEVAIDKLNNMDENTLFNLLMTK